MIEEKDLPDINAQRKLLELELDEPTEIKIGKSVFHIRGLRAKAQTLISKVILTRKPIREGDGVKEQIHLMGKYNSVPYKVLAIAILNNNPLLLLTPFWRIYAWYLSMKLDMKEVSAVTVKVVEKMNIDFFMNTMLLMENMINSTMALTKKEAGALYQEALLAQKEQQLKTSRNCAEIDRTSLV